MMKDYQEMNNRYDSLRSHISKLRMSYASGQRDMADDIIKGEKEIQTLQKDMKALSNEIVRTEQSAE